MKRFLIPVFLSATVLKIAAPSVQAKPKVSAKRLSVLDYYSLLPGIGLSGYLMRRERQQLLQIKGESADTRATIDLRHDYLSVKPDSSPREQVAVFRFNGKDLVAQSAPDYRSDYNGFAFYQLVGGKLRDVTKKVLPIPLNPFNYLLELPSVGTTIKVYRFDLEKQSRKPAFDLLWRRGRFVVAKIKR